jgi:cytochrome P450
VHTTDAGYFELRSGETWRDPFPTYAVLRKHDPVHHVSRGDFWVLTRFDDVWAAAGDPATFSSAQGLTVSYDEIDATGLGDAMPMVFLDPPAHTDFRRLVTRNLTPRKVSMIEPAVRAFVVQRIESAKGQGSVDIVEQLFKPLPSFVVAHYLGVPPDDQALFDRWTEAIVQAAAGDEAAANPSAFAELLAYFTELAERRRTEPGDDIVSDLVRAGIETVSLARILGFAFTMVAGGNDTATGRLAGAACLLTEHPAQRAHLLADPATIPTPGHMCPSGLARPGRVFVDPGAYRSYPPGRPVSRRSKGERIPWCVVASDDQTRYQTNAAEDVEVSMTTGKPDTAKAREEHQRAKGSELKRRREKAVIARLSCEAPDIAGITPTSQSLGDPTFE